jgi:hypothetical protein
LCVCPAVYTCAKYSDKSATLRKSTQKGVTKFPSLSVKSIHTYHAKRRHIAEEEYVIVNIHDGLKFCLLARGSPPALLGCRRKKRESFSLHDLTFREKKIVTAFYAASFLFVLPPPLPPLFFEYPFSLSQVELCRLQYRLHCTEQNADEITTSIKQRHVNFVAQFISTSHFPQNDKSLKLQFAMFSAVVTCRKH